jgi:outer membrane protein with beta-barrel domain
MTLSKRLSVLAFVTASAVPVTSHAIDIKPVLVFGLEFGGEEIATTTSGGSLKFNELFSFGGGASFLTDSKDIEVQVTLAWKYGNLDASDGSLSFTRYPLDALVFYRLPKFRVGGGLTYHLNPQFSASGSASFLDGFKFDNALGVVLQADYLFTEKASIGLRYTNLDYKAKLTGASFSSNGGGLMFGYRF